MLTIKDKDGKELITELDMNAQFLPETNQLFLVFNSSKLAEEDLFKIADLLSSKQPMDMANGPLIIDFNSVNYEVDSVTDLTPRNADSYKIYNDTILLFNVTKACELESDENGELDNHQKLMISEKKGYSYRLKDPKTNETFRVFARDYPEIDFIVGTLLVCDYKASGDMIDSITVHKEIVGDSSKAKVEVCVEDFSIGDLIDGTPILKFGKQYAKKGKKMAYAFFK
ncbi:hypothetical protein CTH30272_03062 [Allocatenococcus thiocycli]|nr:hypothetical protein CTH30272_03062 [Catenococcus thiocycli]